VPPVHAAVRAARLLPPAGPGRLEDPLALRARLLPLLGTAAKMMIPFVPRSLSAVAMEP